MISRTWSRTAITLSLQDPARQRDPSARHAFPDLASEAALRGPRTLAEELLVSYRTGGLASETSFELESHGGDALTVSGTVVYLDEQAQTFLVLGADGGLSRAPLREVKSAHASASR